MTTFRLYRLYRRAGNSPCAAYELTQRAQPGAIASAVCYAAAVLLGVGALALIVTR